MGSISKIKHSFDELKHLPFPEATKNAAISEWISDLAEMDGFYAGLAVSLIKGRKIKTRKFPNFDSLFQDLHELENNSKMSQVRLKEYKQYLEILEKLAIDIEEFTNKKKVKLV